LVLVKNKRGAFGDTRGASSNTTALLLLLLLLPPPPLLLLLAFRANEEAAEASFFVQHGLQPRPPAD